MHTHWIAQRLSAFDEINVGFRKIYELSHSIKDPINLLVGQPDFDVPDPIKEAAIQAIRSGKNAYAPTQALPELAEKIRADLRRRWPQANRDVLVTGGTMGALNLTLLALLNPGDEVILFDPCFLAYAPMIRLFGGVPVLVDTYPDFQVSLDRVEAAVTPRTKALLLCTPGNPTGVVQKRTHLKALAEYAYERRIVLISDEIYAAFCFDEPFISAAEFNPDTIVVSSFSKTYGMTGWRLGYAHGPKELINAMVKVQIVTYVCAPTPAQYAALTAWDYDVSHYNEAYRHKRDLILQNIDKRFGVVKPGGAFYYFIQTPWGTGQEFVEACHARRLLVLPGHIFSQRDTHFRLSFAASDETLLKGIEILNDLACHPPKPGSDPIS